MPDVNLKDLDIRQQATPTLAGDVRSIGFGGENGGDVGNPVGNTDIVNLQTLNTVTADSIKIAGAPVASGNLLETSGTTGEIAVDSGIASTSLANVVLSSATIPNDNILVGDGGVRNSKDGGVTIASLQFDQSLNTTDSPTFSALTTTLPSRSPAGIRIWAVPCCISRS